jgi:hypothetical protein
MSRNNGREMIVRNPNNNRFGETENQNNQIISLSSGNEDYNGLFKDFLLNLIPKDRMNQITLQNISQNYEYTQEMLNSSPQINASCEIVGNNDNDTDDNDVNDLIYYIQNMPNYRMSSLGGGGIQKGGGFKEDLAALPKMYLTMISTTDSLLNAEIMDDPKKVLCNIHDWVMLGTINQNFSELLFTSVEKLIKIHIEQEKKKNASFDSTILIDYLTALQLRLEAAFLDDGKISETVNLPYTDLLRKLFGDNVAQQVKEEKLATGVKVPVKDKNGYTKTEALSVRDEWAASLANKSQCGGAIGDWLADTKCWIVDEKLSNYKPHGVKKGDVDFCPAVPGVDCEHIGGLRFQLIHANTVQTGMKAFRKNIDEYKKHISMFYDWSFHGPNVIKNDEEWMKFDEDTGFFKIATYIPDGRRDEQPVFRKTLQAIYDDAKGVTNKYGCACINMVKDSSGKLEADLTKVNQSANVTRIAGRLQEIIDAMNDDLKKLYSCFPCSCAIGPPTSASATGPPTSTSTMTISSSSSARGAKPSSTSSTTAAKPLSMATRVYYYMCIFKFLSNIPTLQFTNMVSHTANMEKISTKPSKGGDKSQKGGQEKDQIITTISNFLQSDSDILYLNDNTLTSVFSNLLSETEETTKTINTLVYLYETSINTIMNDISETESKFQSIIGPDNLLPALMPDESIKRLKITQGSSVSAESSSSASGNSNDAETRFLELFNNIKSIYGMRGTIPTIGEDSLEVYKKYIQQTANDLGVKVEENESLIVQAERILKKLRKKQPLMKLVARDGLGIDENSTLMDIFLTANDYGVVIGKYPATMPKTEYGWADHNLNVIYRDVIDNNYDITASDTSSVAEEISQPQSTALVIRQPNKAPNEEEIDYINQAIQTYNPNNYKKYFYTIKYYCKLKRNLITQQLKLRKTEENSNINIRDYPRERRPPLTLKEKSKWGNKYTFSSMNGIYNIEIFVPMDQYTYQGPNVSESPLNLRYRVTVKINDQTISVEHLPIILFQNDNNFFKNSIMVTNPENPTESYHWSLEELSKKTLGKGGTKNKMKKNKTKKNKRQKKRKILKTKRYNKNRKTKQKNRKTIKKRRQKNRKTIKYY